MHLGGMLELEEARCRILAVVPASEGETVPVGQASGRFVAGTIYSPLDLPPFPNSAMDGYALRSADARAAKPYAPVCLRVVGRIAAGESFSGELPKGGCVRLFTGSPLPRGADAVVMQEDTRLDPAHPSEVFVFETAKAGENVRLQGEDICRGSAAVESGARLGFGQISLLMAVGLEHVKVGRQPRVGILATGTELREPGKPLESGQIYESNRVALEILVRGSGGLPVLFPIVKDLLASTSEALKKAFETCDLVITSGGASVGELDLLKPAFQQVGGNLEFWKVSIKPGRPFVFGQREGKLLFGLPGNPVSALVTFLLLVRPALLRWQGAADIDLLSHSGVLEEALGNSGNRRHFFRVRIDSQSRVRSAGMQASHTLGSLARANGLLDVPPGAQLASGSEVRVMRWD